MKFYPLVQRLHLIKLHNDLAKDINIKFSLSSFEKYVYGIISQYNRIIQDSKKINKMSITQLHLDIFYYILSWDKLKKEKGRKGGAGIFYHLNQNINELQKNATSIPKEFKNDFKLWKGRINSLFKEFKDDVRNEYEHPSLKPLNSGSIILFGNIQQDRKGNIKAHVGGKHFAIIRKYHVERLNSLYTDLIDLFLKHFSNNILTSELIKIKNKVSRNTNKYIKEYKKCIKAGNTDYANAILSEFTQIQLYLSQEELPLSRSLINRFYSEIFKRE